MEENNHDDIPVVDRVHDGQDIVNDYTFAHGGSFAGPTVDCDGVPLSAGDKVVMVGNHDPNVAQFYDGAHGVVEWAQDCFPFAQVIVEFPDEPRLRPLNTFAVNVRKEA